ncbi:hypothetical protein THIX_70160 [Thiomonas sp. X19]|nr:hypothetical protein THIX_100012 [Thiomonas sp. X19]SCC93793.1 hypothetical protein THIX_40108 [Thiomonas sp. X19]SCC95131.1 hypothetical protein THIX_70160 [Thiomonas sp. X19]
MRAAVGGEVCFELHVEDAREGCSGAGRDERAVGAVPTLRVSSCARVYGAPGLRDGPWSGVAAVDQGQSAGAAQAAQEARRRQQAAAVHPEGARPGQVWAYDFVHDACANGAEAQVLHRDRRVHQGEPDDRRGRLHQIRPRGRGVVPARQRARRTAVRSLRQWPRFRDECLSLEWFRNRTEAKVVIEQWRRHYNEVRPHSSLGYRTPNEFVQQGCSTVKQGAVVQE